MRFMLLLMHEAGAPAAQALAAYARYGDALRRAGILLAFDGLHRREDGVRVRCVDGRATVVDCVPKDVRESVGAYWLIQAGSREEAIEWASRCPVGPGVAIEVRQVLEPVST